MAMAAATDKQVIICTGGAGYIGAHCAVELAATGRYKCILVDDLSNSGPEAVEAILKLGKGDITFKQINLVTEREKLKQLKADGVIHFAAFKAVGESVEKPLEYYDNNLNSLLNVLITCREIGCKNVVFSSSCTVYKPSETVLTEDSPIGASCPYGQTKIMCEQILKDLCVSDNSWKIASLRYFNPVGAHPSGEFGEDPKVMPNLLPIVQKVAAGQLDRVSIFGDNWDTRDGTCIRDYIHVQDVANGHVLALDKLMKMEKGEFLVYNLGTGCGSSVKEVIAAFERTCGHKIPVSVVGRRAGDVCTAVAATDKAEKELGFKVKRSLEEACISAWKWQTSHPDGFGSRATTADSGDSSPLIMSASHSI